MCVYTYIYVYVYIYIYVHVCVCVCECMSECVSMKWMRTRAQHSHICAHSLTHARACVAFLGPWDTLLQVFGCDCARCSIL